MLYLSTYVLLCNESIKLDDVKCGRKTNKKQKHKSVRHPSKRPTLQLSFNRLTMYVGIFIVIIGSIFFLIKLVDKVETLNHFCIFILNAYRCVRCFTAFMAAGERLQKNNNNNRCPNGMFHFDHRTINCLRSKLI